MVAFYLSLLSIALTIIPRFTMSFSSRFTKLTVASRRKILRISLPYERLSFATATDAPIEEKSDESSLFGFDLPTNDNINLLTKRHSTAHVMAMAVQKLFPHIKVTIGPWIENGYPLSRMI